MCVCATLPRLERKRERDIAHEWTRNAIMQPALFSLCPQPEAAAQIRRRTMQKRTTSKIYATLAFSWCALLPSSRGGYPVSEARTHVEIFSRQPKKDKKRKSDCVAKEFFSHLVRYAHVHAG